MRDFFWRVKNFFQEAYRAVRAFIIKILPNPADSQELRSIKVAVFLFVGIIAVMVVISVVTFSVAVKGGEQTLVPNVKGKDLISALQDLQAKQLYPTIQVQFSTGVEKNTVMDQSPSPGTLVKAGKEVRLKVSKGPVLDTVENYVGQSLDEVRAYLQTLFSTNSPNLLIKEPVLYQASATVPPGKIIAQSPKPGTKITGLTYLELVVSRGESTALMETADYVGMSFQEALSALAKDNVPFVFSVQKAKPGTAPGSVIAQTPQAKSPLSFGQIVQLVMTAPASASVGRDMVFGIFKYSLPDYPIQVDVRLDMVSNTGTVPLLAMKHPGGPLAVPYIVPEDSELVLSVLDREEAREKAAPYGQ